jgi:hypothetical protein
MCLAFRGCKDPVPESFRTTIAIGKPKLPEPDDLTWCVRCRKEG